MRTGPKFKVQIKTAQMKIDHEGKQKIVISRNCNFLARISFWSQIFIDFSPESSCIYMPSLKIPKLKTSKQLILFQPNSVSKIV